MSYGYPDEALGIRTELDWELEWNEGTNWWSRPRLVKDAKINKIVPFLREHID